MHGTQSAARYHKWSLIWHFIFVFSAVIEHDCISDFIVVVKLVSIFADIIFIHLRLFSLTYEFPIRCMFYQENNIRTK